MNFPQVLVDQNNSSLQNNKICYPLVEIIRKIEVRILIIGLKNEH